MSEELNKKVIKEFTDLTKLISENMRCQRDLIEWVKERDKEMRLMIHDNKTRSYLTSSSVQDLRDRIESLETICKGLLKSHPPQVKNSYKAGGFIEKCDSLQRDKNYKKENAEDVDTPCRKDLDRAMNYIHQMFTDQNLSQVKGIVRTTPPHRNDTDMVLRRVFRRFKEMESALYSIHWECKKERGGVILTRSVLESTSRVLLEES